MNTFLYHPGEDPQRTLYRVMFWMVLLLNAVLFLWALAASYFDFQSSWTPYPIAGFSFLTILNVGFYGDYAMGRDIKTDTYRFLVIQYFLSSLTLLVSSFAFVQIDQGKAYIKDNWALMSQQVIPFTTQLAQTRTFELLQSGLSWVGWLSALASLPQMQRAFELLDEKHSRFALNPFRVLMPQLGMLFIIAVLTISAGVDAALVSTYGHGSDESALIFTIVTACFVILAVLASVVTAFVLGTHHTTYTIVWLTFAVLAVFGLFGGSVLSSQARDIGDFVGPRWDEIRVFVPTSYQDNGANTYIRDAETLLRYAGLGGVMIFLFSMMLVGTACHSAFLLTALAPAVKAGPDAIHHAVASLRGSLTADSDYSGAAAAAASFSPREASSGYYGSLGAGDEEGGPGASSGLANDGAVGGSARDEDEEGMDEIQIVDSDEEDDITSTPRSPAGGAERGKSASGLELSGPRARGSMSEASNGTASVIGAFGPGPRSVASASVLGGYDRTALPSKDDHTMPSWGEYVQISGNHLRRELGSRLCCLGGITVLVLLGCVLLGVGLAEVGNAARCGALARGTAFKSTYSASFPSVLSPLVTLNNTFPGGRVRYVGYDREGSDEATINVTLTTWSLDPQRVWSQADFESALSFDTAFPPSLTVGMFLKGALSAARQSCDTAELTVYVPLDVYKPLNAVSRAEQLRASADQATAVAKGTSVEEEWETYVNEPRFDMFASSATSIPEGATHETHPQAYAAEIRRVNEVKARAAAEPEAAVAELMARVEDPTALSAIPPILTMASKTAAGYGKNGPASRTGQALLKIGPAYARGAFYLTAQDEYEKEFGKLAAEHLERIRAEALAKHPGNIRIKSAFTAADVRSWDKLLDAQDLADSRVADAESTLAGLRDTLAVAAAEQELAAAQLAARKVRDIVDERLGLGLGTVGAQVFVNTPYAYFDFESSLVFFLPAISRLQVVTDTAPVVLQNSIGLAPIDGGDCLDVVSNTGDVNISSFVAPGFRVRTGGDIFLRGTASAKLNLGQTNPIQGVETQDVSTTGTGTLTITEGLGGLYFQASTEEGLLLVYNCAGAVGRNLNFEAKGSADVWFTTMLLAGGNITTVKTHGGTTHANVVYSNKFVIDGTDGGSAALVELFLGIAPINDAFVPPLDYGYTNPGLIANNPKGSITLTGITGAPASTCPDTDDSADTFPDLLGVDLHTTTDPISVQINGGGINAPYRVYSEHGQATMNIFGNNAPLTGTLGIVAKDKPAKGYFSATSDYGDIDVVELENSIPDLASIDFG